MAEPKTPPKANLNDLKNEFSELEDSFSNFHKFRGSDGIYDQLVNRELSTEIRPELSTLQDEIDYRSPNPAEALSQYIDILTMNPTRFDVVINGAARKDRETERQITLWTAHTWAEMDENRDFDSGCAEGQAKHGLKVYWLRHKPLGQVTIEPGIRRNPFYWQSCVIDGCFWVGDYKNPDAFYYKYSLPVIGSGLKNSEGQKPTIDSANKIGWIGLDESHDSSTTSGKRFDVFVRDSRDIESECEIPGCDHQRRVISSYISLSGGNLGDAMEVDSVYSPFPTCSFIIIPGVYFQTETDPHLKFRPKMEKLYSLTVWDNDLTTTLSILSRSESADNDIYLNIGRSDPATIAAMVRDKEGGPSFMIDRPEPGSNQIAAMVGTLERWPKPTSQHLMALLTKNREELIQAMPNRFMTGNANTEASNATAAAFMLSLEQSSLPFGRLLSFSDGAIGRALGKMIPHAIRYWSLSEGDTDFKYSVALTGSEGALRHSAKTPGEVIMIDAETLACDYELIVLTENRTMAERQQEWYLTLNQYENGAKTSEDLIKAAGSFDVEGQKRLLLRDRLVTNLEPLRLKMQKLYLLRKAGNATGIDFGSLDPEMQEQRAQEAKAAGGANPLDQQNHAAQRNGNAFSQASSQAAPATPQYSGGNTPF